MTIARDEWPDIVAALVERPDGGEFLFPSLGGDDVDAVTGGFGETVEATGHAHRSVRDDGREDR